MEKRLNRSILASLVTLVFLVPVRSLCKEEAYKSLTGGEPECCISNEAEVKRFDDIGYDSFVGLMGRRDAPQPHGHINSLMPRKGHMDPILANLLGLKKRLSSLCAKERLQSRGGAVNRGRKRYQHIL